MEFSIKFDRVKSGWSIRYIEWTQVHISKKCIDFVLENNADPDEMQHVIWVFSFCQSTHLVVSHLQSVNSI